MEETIAHQAMRNELLEWLSGGMSDNTELDGLCEFLWDDFPYDAEHVVGLALRKDELEPWQRLMGAIDPMSTPLRDDQVGPVRERAGALLAAMGS